MKDITFRADEHLIDQARRVARARNTTLNAAFRDWLREYVLCASRGREVVDALMRRLSHVRAGGHFSRLEMNERR
jgi:hypothetical protein